MTYPLLYSMPIELTARQVFLSPLQRQVRYVRYVMCQYLISIIDFLRKDTSIKTLPRPINDSLKSCHDLCNVISQQENGFRNVYLLQ
jgi:hypothetical protein